MRPFSLSLSLSLSLSHLLLFALYCVHSPQLQAQQALASRLQQEQSQLRADVQRERLTADHLRQCLRDISGCVRACVCLRVCVRVRACVYFVVAHAHGRLVES
jgi:hypothetical protein